MPITLTITVDEKTGAIIQASGRHEARKRPPVEDLVRPDRILFLEDNRWYSALTRPLKRVGLTWDAYLAKWDLPADFPKVAANFSSARSEALKRRFIPNLTPATH